MTNENIIQLKGKATIDRPLTADKDYTIEGTVSVTQIRTVPRGDGSEDVTYVVEPNYFSIKNDAGKTINLKKKSTLSQAMRMQIIFWGRDNFPDMDDEALYSMVMGKLLDKLPNILTMIKPELQ